MNLLHFTYAKVNCQIISKSYFLCHQMCLFYELLCYYSRSYHWNWYESAKNNGVIIIKKRKKFAKSYLHSLWENTNIKLLPRIASWTDLWITPTATHSLFMWIKIKKSDNNMSTRTMIITTQRHRSQQEQWKQKRKYVWHLIKVFPANLQQIKMHAVYSYLYITLAS